jgi:hypothetical protein
MPIEPPLAAQQHRMSSMQIPFTAQQFFEVMARYNLAVWPAPVVLQVLALLALVFVLRPHRLSGAVISAVLSVLWAWTGVAYHLVFFTAINPLAYVFGVGSLLAAGVFLVQGVVRRRLEFRVVKGVRSFVGVGLVVFALLVYPLWSTAVGHAYPQLPTFGLPCPTTLFTIGLLSLLVAPYPRGPLVIPIAWCFVGVQAAVLFGVLPDLALLVAAAQGLVLLRSGGVLAPARAT